MYAHIHTHTHTHTHIHTHTYIHTHTETHTDTHTHKQVYPVVIMNTTTIQLWIYVPLKNLLTSSASNPLYSVQPVQDSHIFSSYICDWILENWPNWLGLFHFIGPSNSYTHTLLIHSAITRLGWMVCFSRASFAVHVNAWLRQQDPRRVLHRRNWSEIDPSVSETSLRPFRHVWAYGWHLLDS